MQTAESSQRTRRFSIFEVDLGAAEVRKQGVRIKLQDQPFRILTLLLDRPGELVTREEIREQLWRDHTFVDFDRSLNKAMTKLRSALGDSAECPRYIETVPRHGYRFLLPVDQGTSAKESSGHTADAQERTVELRSRAVTSSPPPPEMFRAAQLFYGLAGGWGFSLFLGVLVTLIVVTLVFAVHLGWPGTPAGTSGTVSPRRSIAVLGFRNLSGDAQQAWLSTALSDWLATELSAGEQLRTIPAESVARMRMELALLSSESLDKKSLARIRKNLGTDLVVEGSYAIVGESSGGQIRLDLRLLDAETGETTAAFSEAGADSHLFDLVSKVGERMRAKLGVRAVTREEAAEVAIALPSNPDAARLYSEGLERLHVFDALAARDLLQKAVAKQPDYSLSHAALATAWSQLGYDQSAKAEARKAFDLSASLSRAERLLVEGQYREVSHEGEKAIEIYRALFEFFPDNLDYGLALCSAEVGGGRGKDALATLARLRQLPVPLRDDPRIDLEEGHVAESQGDFKRLQSSSVAAAEKATAIGASLLQARALTDQGWAFENLGAPDQVEPLARRAEQLYVAAHDQRGVAIAATIGGIALQMQGDCQGAKRKYEESLAIYRQIGYRFGVANEYDNFGDVYLATGDLAQSHKSYQESLQTYVEIGHLDGEALAKAGLGEVALRQGNRTESRKMLEESLQICRAVGDQSKEGAALSGLGRLLRMEGDIEGARRNETEAKAIFDRIGDRSQSAQMQIQLANLLMDQDKHEAAAILAQQAAEFFERAKAVRDMATAGLVLSEAALGRGRILEARGYAERTMATARKSGNLELELSAAIVAARIQATAEPVADRTDSIRQLHDVTAKASAASFASLVLEARLASAEIEIASGKAAAGRAHIEAIEKEAAKEGFGLVVRRAAADLQRVGVPANRTTPHRYQ